MIDADLAFHAALYAAAGNPLIEQSAQIHWRHLRRVMGAVLRDVRQRDTVWDEHAAIAEAIAAGDGSRAAHLIEEHSRQAGEMLAARLDHVLNAPHPEDTRRQP
jgi:DNA-binding GntR family transcriptional regulator